MSTPPLKQQRSPEEIEDAILRKILLITLTPPPDGGDRRVFFAQRTAAEILSEGNNLKLNRDVLDRVIFDRLSDHFPHAEPTFGYLLGCYCRAVDESRKIANMRDKSVKSNLELTIKQAKKLFVSYARIHLGNPDIFFSNGSKISPSLLSVVFSAVDSQSSNPSPPGFLDELFKEGDADSLEPVFKSLYEELRGSVIKVSILGDFQQPLRALLYLINLPSGAQALVNHPWWNPKGTHVNGRVIEMTSILGPFFHVGALPDDTIFKSEPDVGQQCFSDFSTRRPADLLSSFITIKTLLNNLYDGLSEALLSLLKNNATRDRVLEYFAEVINKNSSRSQIQTDPMSSASAGMFVNLSAIMLRLCEPFLDANMTKRDKINANYLFNSERLDLKSLSALHASSGEVTEWVSNKERAMQSQQASSSGESPVKFSFICECFFMTARVMNLGLLKALSDYKSLVQDISRLEETLSNMKAMLEHSPSPQIQLDISRVEKDLEAFTQEKCCYEAQILRDNDFIQRALSFYRLMVVWLVSLVGGYKMPLPSICPMEFACLPEHFVDDALELLTFASRIPKALDGVVLDDFMNFIIMFMASPNYIRNPYLRAKMVEVLNYWMPRRSGSSSTSTLFEGHQLSLEYLVRNLLKLYVDIEFTGSHTQFYDKFNIRHNIAELLEYLWQVPSHQIAWRQIAKEEEKGVYLVFLNFLINDSIYLLDESLNKILELKEMESEMANVSEWERRPAQERQERARHLHSLENIIRIDMKLANEDVSMLAFTSEQITAPFLLPEMVERVASMLNYFLLQLVGPQRKSLTLKDPEKFEFRPKQLLKQIVNIYVNLGRGDTEHVLAAAVSKDGRSYNEQLFKEAADVLWKIGENGKVIRDFIELGSKAQVAASMAMDTEAALGEIPDEFLDPIQYTLMKDPVILPSSRITIDRAVIQRHLLSDGTDPFNRSQLTADMLIPDVDLKRRIEEFVVSQMKKPRGDDFSVAPSKASIQPSSMFDLTHQD